MAKKPWRRRSKLFASFVITTLVTNQEIFVNMSSHLKRKHGIGFSSTVSPSASNNSKSDTSVSTLLLPRQRLLLVNYVKKNLQETFACQSKFSKKRLGQSLGIELINTEH